MVDALASGASARMGVEVRVFSWAPIKKSHAFNNDETIVKKFKASNSGEFDVYNLDDWQIYEEANPRTFAGMYQFWCQKMA